MDPATIAGLVFALGSILTMMILEGGNPMAIFLPAPMILVFGGTFGVAIAGGLLKDAKAIGGSFKKALLTPPKKMDQTVETIVGLAERARREGLLALEDAVKEVDDEFLRDGLQAAVDGTDPEDLRTMLLDRSDQKAASDARGAKFFSDMAGYAPTVGIIGTVISLVHVLENLSDPGSLGHMIAAAFLATLWGVLTANVFWMPIANRLKRLAEVEAAQMNLVVEGVLAIQAGSNPRLVKQRLASLVPAGELKDAA
ncbi:motility protein A [Pseudokineococcus sp. 1T1Z-3]|uniref:motility protein A n=1 Tax=Pseudokineococcus sp. 1T1Z-3 TaxID=3132745 RepID=UPI0030993FAE